MKRCFVSILSCVLVSALLSVSAFAAPNPSADLSYDTLLSVRAHQTTQSLLETPNVSDDESVMSPRTPASVGVSACLGSMCVGSVCVGSACAGSVCAVSGCVGSACAASGCGGSVCIISGCMGESVCVNDCT